MGHDLDSDARKRLGPYIDKLGTLLKDRRKRESFAIYAAGVLGTAERKSVEPIAPLARRDELPTHARQAAPFRRRQSVELARRPTASHHVATIE
jgi:SRSO17 transposase